MMPRKILYIAPSTGIGGVETFLKNVSEYHTGAFIPYFLLFQNGPLGHWLEASEATVFYCRNKPRISRPWTWLSYRQELKTLIDAHQFDIVHSSMSYAALFSWPAARHSTHIWFQHGPVSGLMDRLAYKLPHSGVLYNSEHTMNLQLKINNPANPQISERDHLMPLGTPDVSLEPQATLRQELSKRYSLPDGALIISMACRLQRWKGVHVAIEGIRRLLLKTKRPLAFLIFGDDSWDANYAQELKLQAQGLPVYFSKPVDDVSHIFLASDIVINASTTPEPFGLTLIEAMACGALPIAPNAGGPKEILSKTMSHCLFEPGDADDLAATLVPFVVDAQNLSLAKARSLENFETNYSIETMIGQLENIYTKILDQKK